MGREQVEIYCARTAAHVRLLSQQANTNKHEPPFAAAVHEQGHQATHSSSIDAAATERTSIQFVDPSASCLCLRSGSAFDSFAHSQRQGRRLQASEIAAPAATSQSHHLPTNSESPTPENVSQTGSVASTALLGVDRDDLPPTEASDTLLDDMKRAEKCQICVHPGLWCEGLRGLLEMPTPPTSPWPLPISGDSYLNLWEPEEVRLPKVPRAKAALMLKGAPIRSFTRSESLRVLRRNSLRASSMLRGRSQNGSGKLEDVPESPTHPTSSTSNNIDQQSPRPANDAIVGAKGRTKANSSRWAFVPRRSNFQNEGADRERQDNDEVVSSSCHDGSADDGDSVDILASTKTTHSTAAGRRSSESSERPRESTTASQQSAPPPTQFQQITVTDRDCKTSENGSAAGSLRYTRGQETSGRARPTQNQLSSASKTSALPFEAVAGGENALLMKNLHRTLPPLPRKDSSPSFQHRRTSNSALVMDTDVRIMSRINSKHAKFSAVYRAVKSFLKS